MNNISDSPVTEAAITAGIQAAVSLYPDDHLDRAALERDVRAIIEAAAPHMAYAAGGAAAGVILQLRQLAEEMLASYGQTPDGYRGRVGKVTFERWRKILDGPE